MSAASCCRTVLRVAVGRSDEPTLPKMMVLSSNTPRERHLPLPFTHRYLAHVCQLLWCLRLARHARLSRPQPQQPGYYIRMGLPLCAENISTGRLTFERLAVAAYHEKYEQGHQERLREWA